MPAPEGNQFWKIRSKHGRDKLFATPELLWEAATEYFEWCDTNPFMKAEAKNVSVGNNGGSEIQIIEIPVKRPYTIHGFCLFVGASVDFWKSFKRQLKENDKDFIPTIQAIDQCIYDQKFTGAASGFFNATIISRDLGLKDQSEVVQTNNNFNTSITPEEAKNISDGLNSKY